jgi:tRNA (5-methylaminomethyl-2-thiouridylate)-methyltransferase
MKIAILLSGGVDSSVALRLLQEEGHDLTAFYLKIWLEDELAFLGDCPWEEDLKYARAVCDDANVPLEIVPLQAEYLESVVGHALEELKAGHTPSPDILCNRRIKFGEFGNKIDSAFEQIASGHYARIEESDSTAYLKRSPDPIKDQTYFLSGMTQEQLKRARFPLGPYTKDRVRDLAQKYELPNKDRKDSQGICFLGKISYPDFVRVHLGEKEGNIVELESDEILGQHRGFWFYTIGQRGGLRLAAGPWYVVKKDTASNTIYVSHKTHLEERARDRFVVSEPNWISEPPNAAELQVKLRHGPQLTPCRIKNLSDGKLAVKISTADSGIATGQTAVFYDREICLGGGVIIE